VLGPGLSMNCSPIGSPARTVRDTMLRAMKLSLAEIRGRGLEGRNDRFHSPSWFGRNVTRRLSPYITWLFLRLGISANQCSVLRVLLVIAVGPLFLLADPKWWILAVFLRYGTTVLDCVDGELARLRGTASPEGTFVDEFTGVVSGRATNTFIALGLSLMLGPHAVVIALFALLGMGLAMGHIPLLRSIAFEWGLERPARDSRRAPESGVVRLARRAVTYLLIAPGGLLYLPQLLAASLLDLFFSPFVLFGLEFNFRLLWFALLGLGLAVVGVGRAYITVRGGVTRLL
jgi:phosphatidylglycerophosphate synthase